MQTPMHFILITNRTRTVSQITKGYYPNGDFNIVFEIVLTRISLFHAHPQVEYSNVPCFMSIGSSV